MSAQDLLGADLKKVGSDLRAGFAWWTGELAGLVPERWRRPGARPLLAAQRAPDGGYRFTRDGRTIAAAPASRGGTLPVRLLLGQDEVLVREVNAPDLSDRDMRRLLSLDIDRLTPFHADAVFVDVARAGPGDAPGRRRAMLAAAPREAALAAVADARAAGLEPRAVGVALPDQDVMQFDFLPQMIRDFGEAASGRFGAWALIALLVLANLALATFRDSHDLARLRAAAASRRPAFEAAQRLRRQVLDEDQRRAGIDLARIRGEPLKTLDAVTRALPDGAWVQRLSWNGRAVRIAGYKQQGVDVIGALRASPLLTNVRNSTADIPTQLAAGQPFDVTADLAAEARR